MYKIDLDYGIFRGRMYIVFMEKCEKFLDEMDEWIS